MSLPLFEISAFTFTGLPARVVFGSGALQRLADEVRALGCSRALLLCSPRQQAHAQHIAMQLDNLYAGTFAEATMHTPVAITERALQYAASCNADCLIALGGGSTTGLSKAIALRTDLPQIVCPSTYAGSEATPVVGETQDGKKTTQRSPKILPEVILYDVQQTLALPPDISVVSGINAMAHAAEALYAKDANPLTSTLAMQGLQAMNAALPAIVAAPDNLAARTQALYGAWLCGVCLSQVGMALHHKLCHTLGGSFNLPHAQTHTVLLPHALAYNAAAAPTAMQHIATALDTQYAAQGVFDLAQRLGAPTSLQSLGLAQADIAKAAELAVQSPYWNPRPVEYHAVLELLTNAWHGRCPDWC